MPLPLHDIYDDGQCNWLFCNSSISVPVFLTWTWMPVICTHQWSQVQCIRKKLCDKRRTNLALHLNCNRVYVCVVLLQGYFRVLPLPASKWDAPEQIASTACAALTPQQAWCSLHKKFLKVLWGWCKKSLFHIFLARHRLDGVNGQLLLHGAVKLGRKTCQLAYSVFLHDFSWPDQQQAFMWTDTTMWMETFSIGRVSTFVLDSRVHSCSLNLNCSHDLPFRKKWVFVWFVAGSGSRRGCDMLQFVFITKFILFTNHVRHPRWLQWDGGYARRESHSINTMRHYYSEILGVPKSLVQ
jgi:hypothetical protein